MFHASGLLALVGHFGDFGVSRDPKLSALTLALLRVFRTLG